MEEKDNPTKKKIVANALRLIRERGFDNVTLNDICEAAQVSKHTFYYYFTAKDDILYSFMELPREVRADDLTDIIGAENYFEQYVKLIEPLIDFFAENGTEITKRVFIINLYHKQDTFLQPVKDKFVELEQFVIQKAQDAGDIRNGSDVRALSHASFSLIIAAALFWCIMDGQGVYGLKETVRMELETLFDVKPELRKAKFHIPHSYEGQVGPFYEEKQ